MPAYEHHHVVGFEETSLIGNVYYTNYLLWQGHCRENFLRDHAPEAVEQLRTGRTAFLTRSCSCEYVAEWGLAGLDAVVLLMRLARFRGGRMNLEFEYRRDHAEGELVARGAQEVHCKMLRGAGWFPAPFPAPLSRALLSFADTDELRRALAEAIDFAAEQAPEPRAGG
jgi:enediyne biosynthesis thioesterase